MSTESCPMFFPWLKQNHINTEKIVRANGVYFYTENGQRFIDFKSQNFAANLGHAHPLMLEGLKEETSNITVLASENFCPKRYELARKLISLDKSLEFKKVFYTLGGAEANENAIKMARMLTKRHKIITRLKSYHGASIAMINFSGDYRRIPFDSSITGVVRFQDNIDTLEELIEYEGKETIAAILLEPVVGANGVYYFDIDYWKKIRFLCDKYNILLILDEVFSGFFRCKDWFSATNFNIKPDMITISKGLTAGYAPLGAVLVNEKVANYFEHETLWCGLTQYGHYISCASALLAIDIYEKSNIKENVIKQEIILKNSLINMKEKLDIIGDIRCLGLLAAIDLVNPKTKKPLVPYRAQGEDLTPALELQKLLKQHGVSALVRFSSLIIAPPLIINEEELKKGLENVFNSLLKLWS